MTRASVISVSKGTKELLHEYWTTVWFIFQEYSGSWIFARSFVFTIYFAEDIHNFDQQNSAWHASNVCLRFFAVTVNPKRRNKSLPAFSLTAVCRILSAGHMTPKSMTLKLLQPRTTPTMFLPMSWTSPLTVASNTTPLYRSFCTENEGEDVPIAYSRKSNKFVLQDKLLDETELNQKEDLGETKLELQITLLQMRMNH